MAGFKVGEVTHYYDKVGIAIVDLTADLHVGDRIRISGSTEFSQTLDLIKIEHDNVESASKGDTVGLKLIKPVKPGDEIVRL